MNANVFFEGPANLYGKLAKNCVPLSPLTLGRVMENRSFRSNSPLFKLPIEILTLILELVDDASLPSVALVNIDFRNFARSRQFSSVHLDYSHSSEALVNCLLVENHARLEKNGPPSTPYLGACIRRLTVATMNRIFLDGCGQERIDLRNDARIVMENAYIPNIQTVLPGLPHLETFAWEVENAYLPENFLAALACSSIKHLKIYRPILTKNFEIRTTAAWPLRTLHMEFYMDYPLRNEAKARFCSSLLRLCAPTLETLLWTDGSLETYQTFGNNCPPNFPRLRTLTLGQSSMDTSVMEVFLKCHLENLFLTRIPSVGAGIYKALNSHGCMPSLKMFSHQEPQLNFLRSNRHLSKLDFQDFSANLSLLTDVLPLLSTFPNLKSLRVYFNTGGVHGDGFHSRIPETGLRLLGKLKSLNQLFIACGRSAMAGAGPWLVDHDEIRQHLSPLSHLRRLAFGYDTYKLMPILPRVLPGRETRFREHHHNARIMAEVEKYLQVFPDLEWILLGGCAIRIEPMKETSTGVCRRFHISDLKGTKKDRCLGKMFGWEWAKPYEANSEETVWEGVKQPDGAKRT